LPADISVEKVGGSRVISGLNSNGSGAALIAKRPSVSAIQGIHLATVSTFSAVFPCSCAPCFHLRFIDTASANIWDEPERCRPQNTWGTRCEKWWIEWILPVPLGSMLKLSNPFSWLELLNSSISDV